MTGRAEGMKAYYDAEVDARADRPVDPTREARRSDFLALLRHEGRQSLVDVGSGPGRDAVVFAASGLHVECIDPSREAVARCASRGLIAHEAGATRLPQRGHSVDAGWTMSALVHLDDEEVELAVGELARVLVPGAPIAVGTWASSTVSDETSDRAGSRFFRFRTDDSLQRLLGRCVRIEEFATWHPQSDPSRTYQWALLRTPDSTD